MTSADDKNMPIRSYSQQIEKAVEKGKHSVHMKQKERQLRKRKKRLKRLRIKKRPIEKRKKRGRGNKEEV